MRTLTQKDIYIPVFPEASFTTAKTWGQSKCSNKEGVVYIHTYKIPFKL